MYIVLIHWKPEEAAPRRDELQAAGHTVKVVAPTGTAGLQFINADVDAILIDLGRLPMQGRAVGIELRKRAATRYIPMVFVGGAPEKVAAIRELLPDAGYIEWTGVPAELERAIRRAPESPVVPGTMAGYSGTTLPRKLGIKAGCSVALIAAPEGFAKLLTPLPDAVRIVTKPDGAQRAVVFIRAMKDLMKLWPKVVESVASGATVWIAWPKKTSGIRTDVSETAVRAHGLERGWVDYKIAAIDETWSGLAFSKRKPITNKQS
jgi:CheY-like chemotaxis protein